MRPNASQTRSRLTHAPAAGLPSTETAALAAYQAQGSRNIQDCLNTLRKAATTKTVPPEVLEGALVYLEQQGQKGPGSSVEGTWRLVFGTTTKVRLFQYIPVVEDFVIDLPQGVLALESVVGPFSFVIGGVVRSWESSGRKLTFQFKQVDIKLLGKKIWQVLPTTQPKVYTFFYIDDEISAARSSSGGVTLMRRSAGR